MTTTESLLLRPEEIRSGKKKRSFLLPKEPSEFIGDVENDDATERRKIREVAPSDKNEAKASTPRKKPVTVLSNLSKEELEDHYSRCIQLCNQNKVNTKNAFKLQLIDYMKLILTKHPKKTENLSLMSCTLDASAKIYACRVDKVYSDMIKVMSGKDWTKDDDGASTDSDDIRSNQEDEFAEDEAPVNDNKKKKKKDLDNKDLQKMLASPSDFQMEKIEYDGESIYEDKTTLPRCFDYFLNCPIDDPNGSLMLNGSLFNNSNKSSESVKFVKAEELQKFKKVSKNVDPVAYLPNYSDILKSFHVLKSDSPSTSIHIRKSLAYDDTREDEVPEAVRFETGDSNIRVASEEPVVFCDYDNSFSDEEPEMVTAPTPVVNNLSKQTNEASFSVKGMMCHVSAKHNDYSYFDNNRLSFWAGPLHWAVNRKIKSSNVAEGKKPVKRNVPTLNFSKEGLGSDYDDEDETCLDKKLAKKTMKTWSQDKLSLPDDGRFTAKDVLKFFNNKQLLFVQKGFTAANAHCSSEGNEKESNERLPEVSDLNIEGRDEMESNDAQVESDHFDDYCGDAGSPLPDNSRTGDQALTELELLPVPITVNKINLRFAKFQKRIDMKLLKSTIWRSLRLDSGSDENVPVSNNTMESVGKHFDKVNFSMIYDQLFKELPKEEAMPLSISIAFMGLLHLANEKVLQLVGDEHNHEIVVQLAVPPYTS